MILRSGSADNVLTRTVSPPKVDTAVQASTSRTLSKGSTAPTPATATAATPATPTVALNPPGPEPKVCGGAVATMSDTIAHATGAERLCRSSWETASS